MRPQDTPVRIPLRARDGSIRDYALVDAEDAPLAEFRWSLSCKGGYATRSIDGRKVYLHRVVAGLTTGDGLEADHINRCHLDCRRSNLRVGTHALNGQNIERAHGESAYRGVYWHKQRAKWHAQVKIGPRRYNLGLFADEHEAGRVAAEFRAQHMPYATS